MDGAESETCRCCGGDELRYIRHRKAQLDGRAAELEAFGGLVYQYFRAAMRGLEFDQPFADFSRRQEAEVRAVELRAALRCMSLA